MSERLARARAWAGAHPGVLAIAMLALTWGLVMHQMGWGQTAHYAQVRALADGRADIDPWHWETMDKAWVDGHFYSVKAPGLPLLSLPAYLALDGANAQALAADAAANARGTSRPKWTPRARPPYADHGFSQERAAMVERRVEVGTPMVWALTLLVALIPAVALLVLVRRTADRFVPGYGVAAAITLGLGTVVMTFASEYFSHVISAAMGFGAFALLMREREGPPRAAQVALAGLLCGLAVTFEYPVGLVGVVLFAYALSRDAPRIPRALAFGAAAVAGTLPVFAFNQWAFGSPLTFAYGDAVSVQGLTGHAELGLNDDGFFGITVPELDSAVDLLLANRGLLTLTPVILAGVVGAWFLRRSPRRAEANVILAVAAVFFAYNAGYWLPFGGGTPGARFLIPALPFIALGMAEAYRRYTAPTLALAIPSALLMLAASITYPLIGDNGTWLWFDMLRTGNIEHTLLTALGVSSPWVAIAPVLVAAFAAGALAVRATPAARLGSIRPALAVLAGWALISAVGPTVAGDVVTPLDGGPEALILVGGAAAASAAALLVLRQRERRAQRAPGSEESAPALASS